MEQQQCTCTHPVFTCTHCNRQRRYEEIVERLEYLDRRERANNTYKETAHDVLMSIVYGVAGGLLFLGFYSFIYLLVANA